MVQIIVLNQFLNFICFVMRFRGFENVIIYVEVVNKLQYYGIFCFYLDVFKLFSYWVFSDLVLMVCCFDIKEENIVYVVY